MQDELIDAYFVCIRKEQFGGEGCQKCFDTNNNIKGWKIDIVKSGL